MVSTMFKSHFCGPKKNLKKHLRPFFNEFINADSESVFNFFLSCLELEKLEVKVFKILHHIVLRIRPILYSDSTYKKNKEIPIVKPKWQRDLFRGLFWLLEAF